MGGTGQQSLNNNQYETKDKNLVSRLRDRVRHRGQEKTVVATVVGKDSGLGTVYPAVAGQDAPSSGKTKVPRTAKERIERSVRPAWM